MPFNHNPIHFIPLIPILPIPSIFPKNQQSARNDGREDEHNDDSENQIFLFARNKFRDS